MNNYRSSATSANGQKFLYKEEKSAKVSSSNEDDVLNALDAAFPKDDKQGFLKRARFFFKTRSQGMFGGNQPIKDDSYSEENWKSPQKESKK